MPVGGPAGEGASAVAVTTSSPGEVEPTPDEGRPPLTASSPGEEAQVAPRRRRKAPWIALALLLVLGGAGAPLAMGLVPGVPGVPGLPGLLGTGRRHRADAGAPPASASPAAPDAGAPRAAIESLAGLWVGNGRELEAVVAGADLEFRVKKPDQFPRQGYEAGEARFVLRATADASVFAVEDHIRPVPPAGRAYDTRARGTCQEVWTAAGADPLRARHDGSRLSVEFAKIEPAPGNFIMEGSKVTSCVGLHDLKASKVVSVLTRP